MLNKYVVAANITKKVTTHTLRHSFATHLMEAGTDIFLIKKLMGHSTIKATCFYLHIAAISTINVKSPIDTIYTENKING
jgi:site-specific recombinase XerD